MLQYLDLELDFTISILLIAWSANPKLFNATTLSTETICAVFTATIPELWWWYPWCDLIPLCPWWCLFWSLLPCKSLLSSNRLLSLLLLTLEGILRLCARVLNNKYYRKQRGSHNTLKRFSSSWQYSELNVTWTPLYSLPLRYKLITPK